VQGINQRSRLADDLVRLRLALVCERKGALQNRVEVRSDGTNLRYGGAAGTAGTGSPAAAAETGSLLASGNALARCDLVDDGVAKRLAISFLDLAERLFL